MALTVRPDDERLSWLGAVSLQKENGWVMPWRIPYEQRDLFPEALWNAASMPAGVRIAFRSDTTCVAGNVTPIDGMAPIDLCCDGELVGSVEMSKQPAFAFDGLSEGDKLVELWLPQRAQFRLSALELSDGASLEPHADTRLKWITYGSSISHCGGATSPVYTWPGIVAREQGLDLTCFGYGGQCHLDPMMARLMRDLPADVVSLKVGINIKGGSTLNPRSFRAAIIGSVKTIRDGHPNIPVVVLSPIFAPPHEQAPNAVGFTIEMMRDEVVAAVAALRNHGDANVYYVSGLELLGTDDEGLLLEDGVHPSADGYKAMGRNFVDRVAAKLFPSVPNSQQVA